MQNIVSCQQDIGRLPSGEEKIDCISVSFAPVRNEVEHINRKFWDTLELTLKKSIVSDIDEVQNCFIFLFGVSQADMVGYELSVR